MFRLKFKSKNKGFTLVELMVTVIIFVLVTVVVLLNTTNFNSNVLLTNLAYEVALQIREAQTFGINVRGLRTGQGGSDEFRTGYGVRFDKIEPARFIFFADKFISGQSNGNYNYDDGFATCDIATTECLDIFKLNQGNIVERFCGTISSTLRCSDFSTNTLSGDVLDIIFVRPNPDALISDSLSGGYESAEIILRSPGGNKRRVLVEASGQISVDTCDAGSACTGIE